MVKNMKLQNIILPLIIVGLIVTESGCIDKLEESLPDTDNIQIDDNSGDDNYIEETELPKTEKIISDKKIGDLKIAEFEVKNSDNNNPFRAKVTDFKTYDNYILATIKITKTNNFETNASYVIKITSPRSDVLFKPVRIGYGLKHIYTYEEKGNGFAEAFGFKVTDKNVNNYEISIIIGSTKSNIVYSEYKKYVLFEVVYFKKKTETSYIILGHDTIYGIYNSSK